jgi:lipoprotein NlpD
MKMSMSRPSSLVLFFVHACMICSLTACMSAGRSMPAPVEDRANAKTGSPAKTSDKSASASKASASALTPEPGHRSDTYTVKQGDTLIKIGLDHGHNWRDIMRWNAIDNPNVIEVGQVLRVAPPAADSGKEEVVVKPVAAPSTVTGSVADAKTPPTTASNPPPAAAAADSADESLPFSWPAQGNVLSGFDEAKNKGIDITGKAGDPVLASADGRVVYAGAGLRGYGNLVILKHNNTYLTAYAHNQSILVKEDQMIKRGQKIAEMGNSDSEQVKLHFEIRKSGKPVDPIKLLAPR